jgi:predicted PurR-regulated permease PerM
MAETAPQPTGSRISPLQTMALVVVVVAGLKLASAVLIPVLLALFLTIVCMPPVNFLRRRGLPSGLAIPLVILGLLIVLSALLLVVGNSISEFTRNIGKYQESLDGLVASARQTIEGMGIDLADQEVKRPSSTPRRCSASSPPWRRASPRRCPTWSSCSWSSCS